MPVADMSNDIETYLSNLPDDRREALEELRSVILQNLPGGYEEGMQYGMIGYYVPHELYPDGYHCDSSQPVPFIGIDSKKRHMSIHFFGIYVNPKAKEAFVKGWKESGCRLDMGAACFRFRRIEDVPLAHFGKTIKSLSVKTFLKAYENSR